jgi:hypothetical protein
LTINYIYYKNKCQINENNKEHITEQRKQYYLNNKEQQKHYYLNNKSKFTKQFNCECGSQIQVQKKARHLKSKKHQNWLNNNLNKIELNNKIDLNI